MQKVSSLSELGEKYKICQYCQKFLTKPDSVADDFLHYETHKHLVEDKTDFKISDFVHDAVCTVCLGIWPMLHSQTFYERMLREVRLSQFEHKSIQLVIKFPLTLKLRYILCLCLSLYILYPLYYF